MLNHVRTLLLNESCTTPGVPSWLLDQEFTKLQLDSNLAEFYSILFMETDSVEDKAHRVDSIVPFVFAPEFSAYLDDMDSRVTVATYPDVKQSTVPEFYGSITGEDFSFVEACLSSLSASLLFKHVDDVDVDGKLDALHEIWSGSKETAKRFSACVVTVVVLLDFQYRKAQ